MNYDIKASEIQESSHREVTQLLSKIHFLKHVTDKLEIDNYELKQKLKVYSRPKGSKTNKHQSQVLLQKVLKKHKHEIIQSMSKSTVERLIIQISEKYGWEVR